MESKRSCSQLLQREGGAEATEMAVRVAVAARDSEIARLEREMLELEDR